MPPFENFRTARWIRMANLVLQAVLVVTLFGGLNYLASDHPWPIDLTRSSSYSLSPETQAYLKQLPAPVRIVVTQDEGATGPELAGLLREYAYATESNPDGRITVEYLDIDLRRREAENLGLDQSGVILLLSGDNRRLLAVGDLYRTVNGAREFQGEEALTSAILDVTNPIQKHIYFLVGHGELSLDSTDATGLSTVREQLQLRNFHVSTLDLATARRVPADAALLISVEPRSAFSRYEEDLLRQYLGSNAGRLILFLAPGLYPTGLENLLLDWGVVAENDLICDRGERNLAEDGDLIIRDFRPHPVTQALVGKVALRIGPARTVRTDPARADSNGLDAVALAATSASAWGEINPAGRSSAAYNPRIDIPPGRQSLAVASEPVAARGNLPFSVQRGRLVVFGTGDLIDNVRIGEPGALDILLGAVNWTVDRDAELNVPPRPIERFQLALSESELRDLRLCLVLGLPGAALLLGLVVTWTRRH